MAGHFRLRVLTPDRTLFDGPVEIVIARSTEGEIGILAHHARVITPLVPHALYWTTDKGEKQMVVAAGGFLEVGPEETVVLANAAEFPQEIDRARAEAARKRALERLESHAPEVDVARAQAALARAEARLQAVSSLLR
ncbi:ATP synthase subunit epsilon [Candidatus Hydrogenisulfobacillus filiaventi]|uniref:ATP synthase epsilon chain n=1 Tax=Candidatus Hydrogenisulfobacillus filiaventi TaxID=2707344 RepID=A0A6F8ZEG5_9FIRM|nr:ATP synthase F1 subunit epsilon [Bacillota bacterium]CAB1128145.1 ATP synthase subunit epsilon [Candidatus Hydrogenisulfobacillus filiaventi]